jgi:hypothetical protein
MKNEIAVVFLERKFGYVCCMKTDIIQVTHYRIMHKLIFTATISIKLLAKVWSIIR